MSKRKNECRSPTKKKPIFISVIYSDRFKEYEIISDLLQIMSYEMYTTLISDCFKFENLKTNFDLLKNKFLDKDLLKCKNIKKKYKTKTDLLNDFEKINTKKSEISLWISENIIAKKLQIYANNIKILNELKKSDNILNLFCNYLPKLFNKSRLIDFCNKIKQVKKRKCKQDIKSLFNFIKDNDRIEEYVYDLCIENSAIEFKKKIKIINLAHWFRQYKINVGMVEIKRHSIFDIKLNNILDQLSDIKIKD